MLNKRNESHWGKPYSMDSRQAPTSFEEVVRSLRLRPHQYKDSPSLKAWVRQNKNGKYVPPDLLTEFGFEVSDER